MQTVTVVWFAVGCVVGAVVVWLYVGRISQRLREQLAARNAQFDEWERTRAGLQDLVADLSRRVEVKEIELREEQKSGKASGEQLASARAELQAAKEKIELLTDSENRLSATFAALSRRALAENSGQFLDLAKTSFATEQEKARGELKSKQDAFLDLIKPVSGTMDELKNRVEQLSQDKDRLATEAKNLSSALRKADVRGRWGELHLQRVAELAGMRDRCDFSLQQTFRSEEDRRKRPDMVVNLPLGRYVVVDSKAVMDAYISACECADPVQAAIFHAKHAELVRDKIDELAKIDYARVLEKKGKNVADMVVCFIPGEAFFAAAVSQDPTLLEYAARKRVFLASPTILITLLRAIALGWRDHELSANAEHISRLGKELYSRLGTMKSHFDSLGKSIRGSVEHYNEMVASLNSRVFPQARQFRELNSVEAGAKEIGEGTFIEGDVRPTDGSDWEQPMLIAASGEDQES
jgi:DNA recombination protein RmuC